MNTHINVYNPLAKKPIVQGILQLQLDHQRVYLYHGLDLQPSKSRKYIRVALVKNSKLLIVISGDFIPVHYLNYCKLDNNPYTINNILYYKNYIQIVVKVG